MVAVLVTVPVESRPLTVNKEVPVFTLGLALTVSVDPVELVPEPFAVSVIGFGLKLAVTLEGRPLTLSVTLPEKDPAPATVMRSVPLLPRFTVRLMGLGVRVMVPAGVTTNVRVVEEFKLPLVPLTVSV